jgi:hypothetical protein
MQVSVQVLLCMSLIVLSINCDTGVTQNNSNNLGNDTCGNDEYRYQCKTAACASEAQRRPCIGETCGGWETIESCGETQVCWSNENGAGCTNCDFGCSEGKCLACKTGPCCENGAISSAGTPCGGNEYQITEMRCLGNGCGDEIDSRILRTTCDGKSAECNGTTVPISDWTFEIKCASDSICNKNTGCISCEKECFNGKCIQCTGGPCCDVVTGEWLQNGTKCNLTVGSYCDPSGFDGIIVVAQKYQLCDGKSNGCSGPSYVYKTEFFCGPEKICTNDINGAQCL